MGLGPRLWKPPPKDRERQRKKKQMVFSFSQINAIPADARMQLFKEHLSAQLAGDFWILSAVRTGRSFVWVS